MLKYLTNTIDQIYLSALLSAGSELLAYGIFGSAYEKFGMKVTFGLSFIISTVGAGLILTIGLQDQSSLWFPVFFLITNFGLCCDYNLIVIANMTLFEVNRTATAFGISSFIGRMVQSSSPIVSSLEQPVPMHIFSGISVACGLIALLVKVPPKEIHPKSKESSSSGKP